jgi:predicted acylesterase/phospholipase RssA
MKVGLVLGGGGSRGLAHIGVLQVLVRERIPIDLIVGTSMGGIVGLLFASGVTPERMIAALDEMQNQSLFNLKQLTGRSRQRALQELLSRALEDKTFADLDIPTTVMAVDMVRGIEVGLNEGAVLRAALATSAVPALMPLVEIDGVHLADGGVIDSLSTRIAHEQGADCVIAVDVDPPLDEDNPWVDPISAVIGSQLRLPFPTPRSFNEPNALSALWRSFRIISWHVHSERLAAHPPDVLLRPAVAQYGSLDFKDVEGPVSAGVAEAERRLHDLKAVVGRTDDNSQPDPALSPTLGGPQIEKSP